jgi:NitT/TauT family transport system ATP-binding protein
VPAGPPVIELRDVHHTFANGRESVAALANISLAVASGEFVTLLGPSGCGKSTLLRLVGGLIDTTRGSVTVHGRVPSGERASKTFALAPQQPALLPWRTVRQNAQLLLNVNKQGAVDALLAEVGLQDFADVYPHQLSGGMQQRVALVRAFALEAPILLLDEPFAALDELTRAEMRHLLLDLWTRHQSTALFVTHSVAEAVLLSDRVVVLSGRPGHIVGIERIDLPRPRDAALEDTDEFDHIVRRLRALLRESAR